MVKSKSPRAVRAQPCTLLVKLSPATSSPCRQRAFSELTEGAASVVDFPRRTVIRVSRFECFLSLKATIRADSVPDGSETVVLAPMRDRAPPYLVKAPRSVSVRSCFQVRPPSSVTYKINAVPLGSCALFDGCQISGVSNCMDVTQASAGAQTSSTRAFVEANQARRTTIRISLRLTNRVAAESYRHGCCQLSEAANSTQVRHFSGTSNERSVR